MWKAATGVVVGFVLGLMVTMPLDAAKSKPKDTIRLKFDNALSLFIPFIEGSDLLSPYLHFRHICCDCRSVHDVVLEARSDGIMQYWWTNEKQTHLRRRQIGLGMDPSLWNRADPFSAENMGLPREGARPPQW
jgi:hypothetical protein